MADDADNASRHIDGEIEALLAARRSQAILGRESLIYCEDCESEIPEARRKHAPGVTTCVPCQGLREAKTRR